MRKLLFSFLTVFAFQPITSMGQTKCDTLGAIVRSIINSGDEKYLTDGQSYKLFFGKDETSKVVITLYEGFNYKIATTAGFEDNYMIFELLDEQHNLLFSNVNHNNVPYWNFKVENTIETTIEVKLDPNRKINGCAQMIIAYKKDNYKVKKE